MLLRPLLTSLLLAAAPAAAETRLVMVEQPGCLWCARWDAEVGAIYGRTPEGRAAPLMRVPLAGPLPAGVAPATFTPTFVLLRDGREMGRIEGYPGEGFFWALLAEMLEGTPEG